MASTRVDYEQHGRGYAHHRRTDPRIAAHVHAVSRLHREVTEQLVLGRLWPGRAAPIVAVTNGVHPRTWTPTAMVTATEAIRPAWRALR